jgi:tight adherence protein B
VSAPLVVALLVAAALAVLRGPRSGSRLRAVLERSSSPMAPRRFSVPPWRARRVPQVRALAERWAAGVRAGRSVDDALDAALSLDPGTAAALPRSVNAARLHGDVAAAMVADADGLDAGRAAEVRALAACWTVGRLHGGGLADAVERVAESVRADELHRSHVRSELAGAHASARLLAVLPIAALTLSLVLGITSPGALLARPWALGALAAGLVLDVVGLWWTAVVVRAAERTA